jgi:hypothetical protein
LANFFEVLGQFLRSSWKKNSKYIGKNFEFLFERFEQTIFFFEDAKFPGSPISFEGITIFLEKILAKIPNPELLRSIPATVLFNANDISTRALRFDAAK